MESTGLHALASSQKIGNDVHVEPPSPISQSGKIQCYKNQVGGHAVLLTRQTSSGQALILKPAIDKEVIASAGHKDTVTNTDLEIVCHRCHFTIRSFHIYRR